eukprot:CAMPEP_0184305424 /NCGR_PEP_ID=MMETSP1049-20130417/14707_1 /TAXON_ID=77928 /ORGANISM="Proteomonas sulcata, Strain CCMP704" /LENGTH=208 /DNA_ID=CAMNT_0026617485 /DNA_START=86 /DNA_END=710 /DNA_ORIENTATION=+
MVAHDNPNATKHMELEDVPNLHVMKLMESLTSRGYVRRSYTWKHHYWFLTNEGITYLREYLNLPEMIVPNTHKKQQASPPPGLLAAREETVAEAALVRVLLALEASAAVAVAATGRDTALAPRILPHSEESVPHSEGGVMGPASADLVAVTATALVASAAVAVVGMLLLPLVLKLWDSQVAVSTTLGISDEVNFFLTKNKQKSLDEKK